MEASTRVIAALRKDSRERNIEDFNAIFEFFVQVTRIKSLINFAHLHKFRNLLPNPSAVTIIIVQSKLYVRRIIMSHILKTFYFYFIVMLTVTNFSYPILLPGQMLV